MTDETRRQVNTEVLAELFADGALRVRDEDDTVGFNIPEDVDALSLIILAAAGISIESCDSYGLEFYDTSNTRFLDDTDERDDCLPFEVAELPEYLKKINWNDGRCGNAAKLINLLKASQAEPPAPSNLQEIGEIIGLEGSDANDLERIKARLKELKELESKAFTSDVLQSFGKRIGIKGKVSLERFENKLKEIMEKSITPDELETVIGVGFTGSCTKETILNTVKAKLEEVPKHSDEEYRSMRSAYEDTFTCVVRELGITLPPRTLLKSVKEHVCRKIQQLKEAAANTTQENCNQALLEKINNQLGVLGSTDCEEQHVVAAVKHNHELYMRAWKGLQDIGRALSLRHTEITVADILAEIAKREDLAIARPEGGEVIPATGAPSQATVNATPNQPNFFQTLMLLELMFGGKKKKKA